MGVETSEQGLFFQDDWFEGHMLRFTLNMNIFPSISLETPYMCIETSEQCSFFQDDQFEGSHA